MENRNPRLVWLLTAAAFYAFFLFGFADNLKGPTIPALLTDLHYGYARGGTILLASYLGFLVATLFTGMLADAAGKKAVMYVAGAALLVGAAGYSAASSFWALAAFMVVLGLGMGSIEVGTNAVVVDLHRERKGQTLNLMAVFHGFGATLGPLCAGQLLAAGSTWRMVYRLSLLPFALMPLCFLFLSYPRSGAARSGGLDFRGLWRALSSARMGWFYLLITTYVATEIGVGAWGVAFLQQAKGQSVVTSSGYLSLFFAAFIVGRALGSLVVERVGYLRLMLLAAAGGGACLVVAIFGPPSLSFALVLVGLFFSIIFPTITAAVSDLHGESQGAILGVLFTFAGIGGMLGPWAIGVAGDLVGIRLGFGVLVAFCLLSVAALLALLRLGAVPSRRHTGPVTLHGEPRARE